LAIAIVACVGAHSATRPAKRLGDGAHALIAWAFRPVGKA
jgi:hypothetical protein